MAEGRHLQGVPALTVNQLEEGMESLEKQAKDRKASSFTIVPPTPGLSQMKLGLAGVHQYQNANLAVHLVHEFLRVKAPLIASTTWSAAIVEGLQNARWPGRCQTIPDPQDQNITWFLDGAHTVDSLDCCIQWFFSPEVALRDLPKQPTRVMVFNCTHGRNGSSFLATMISKAETQLQLHGQDKVDKKSLFSHVVFSANNTYADGGFKGDLTNRVVAETTVNPLKLQEDLASAWAKLIPEFPAENIHVTPSIEHAVRLARGLADQDHPVDVLVTGSLHLVGGMIEVAGLSEVAL